MQGVSNKHYLLTFFISSWCWGLVCVLCCFIMLLWVGLVSVIVAFSEHTHLSLAELFLKYINVCIYVKHFISVVYMKEE